uniref:Uncharacterized protein n=1 Tax=Oryza meridionalis TaxID=40149 RepID=A0A0E0C4Z1_9ORYZ
MASGGRENGLLRLSPVFRLLPVLLPTPLQRAPVTLVNALASTVADRAALSPPPPYFPAIATFSRKSGAGRHCPDRKITGPEW